MDEKKLKPIKRKRDKRIVFYLDEAELKFVTAKMMLAKKTNREAFIRDMLIHGKIVHNDFTNFEIEMRNTNRYISNAVSSLNQIAKRVNSTDRIYQEDLEEIKRQIEILSKTQIAILECFRKAVKKDN